MKQPTIKPTPSFARPRFGSGDWQFGPGNNELWVRNVARVNVYIAHLFTTPTIALDARKWSVWLWPQLSCQSEHWQKLETQAEPRYDALTGSVLAWPITGATMIHLERMGHRGWHLAAWRGDTHIAQLALWVGKKEAKMEDMGT